MMKTPLTWRSRDDFYLVKVDRRCLQRLRRLAAKHHPKEVGSALVGYYSDDQRIAYITSISPVPSDSASGRTWFVRGVKGLPDFFQGLGMRFRGKRFRVGEWHSHPNASPDPSPTDNANQNALAHDPQENLPEAILLILGGEPVHEPLVGLHVYSRSRGRIDLIPVA